MFDKIKEQASRAATSKVYFNTVFYLVLIHL